jgi:NitT/TauT family transport system permease protein
VWELVGRQLSDVLLAPPSDVVVALFNLIITGELIRGIFISLKPLLIAFGLSIIIGVPIGILIGYYKRVAFFLEPLVNALYSTPLAALVPLVMLWFGMQTMGKVAFIFLIGIFPIIINTIAGVRNTDYELIEVSRSFNASWTRILIEITIPYSVPFIFTGIRLGVGRAVVGMIVAEMYLALTGGLGHMVYAYGASFSTANLFALLIVIPLLGISLTKLTLFIEYLATPWRR